MDCSKEINKQTNCVLFWVCFLIESVSWAFSIPDRSLTGQRLVIRNYCWLSFLLYNCFPTRLPFHLFLCLLFLFSHALLFERVPCVSAYAAKNKSYFIFPVWSPIINPSNCSGKQWAGAFSWVCLGPGGYMTYSRTGCAAEILQTNPLIISRVYPHTLYYDW